MRNLISVNFLATAMLAGLVAAAFAAPAHAKDIEQRCLAYAGRVVKPDESKTPGCECLKKRLTRRYPEEALDLSKIDDPGERYAAAPIGVKVAMDICAINFPELKVRD